MSTYHYPPLNEAQIKLILSLFATYPDYFDVPGCPYSDEIKELFKGESKVLDFESHQTAAKDLSDDQILQEISDLHQKLKDYWDEVKTSDKSADKNTFFRVAVALLERIVNLREQMSNLSQVNVFIDEVLRIMEQVLTPDQRSEVTERLKKFGMEPKDETRS